MESGALRVWRLAGVTVVAGALLSMCLSMGSSGSAGAALSGCNADGDCTFAPSEFCNTTASQLPTWLGSCEACTSLDPLCQQCTGDSSPACTSCSPGYQPSGSSCLDVDECAGWSDNCDPNATCTNTPGSFSCTCNPGYEGDGVTCTLLPTPTPTATDTPTPSPTPTATPTPTSTPTSTPTPTATPTPTFVGLGQSCNSPTECASGFCAQGVCCNQQCTGALEACDRTGSKGTCTKTTPAPAVSRNGLVMVALLLGAVGIVQLLRRRVA